MSYASVASHNAPPPSQQPHADPALLNTDVPVASHVADDTVKVGVVSSDFKEHPATTTSEAVIIDQYPPTPAPAPSHAKSTSPTEKKALKKKDEVKDKAQKKLHDAEEEGLYLWDLLKEQLFRPGVAGGLIGVVNLGLLGGATYAFYTHPFLRHDVKHISYTAAATVALLSAEGYVAKAYSDTAQGQQEARKAKAEGAAVYRYLREHILRPGVLGGLVGIANVGILGAVAYAGYVYWDDRRWDKRYVSAITAGLLMLWSGEGYLAEQIREGKVQPPRP